jgi:hypothetical protein
MMEERSVPLSHILDQTKAFAENIRVFGIYSDWTKRNCNSTVVRIFKHPIAKDNTIMSNHAD